MKSAALLIACACALVVPATANAAGTPTTPAIDVPLAFNESLPGFVAPKRTIKIHRGTVKFTTYNLDTNKNQHGIGIDGGAYNNIKGAVVKPDRSSSLTVSLRSGTYKVFDSAAKLPNAPYVTVKVLRSKPRKVTTGTACNDVFESSIRVYRATCREAELLEEDVFAKWQDADYQPVVLKAGGYSCRFKLFTKHGLSVNCRDGRSWIKFL